MSNVVYFRSADLRSPNRRNSHNDREEGMRRYSTAPSWIGAFLALVLLVGVHRASSDDSHRTTARPRIGAGMVSTAIRSYRRKHLRRRTADLYRPQAIHADPAGHRVLPRFRSGTLPALSPSVRHLFRSARYPAPGSRQRGLCSDHSGRQLGTGLASRRLQLCCIADGPRPRPPVPADFDRPRPALKR